MNINIIETNNITSSIKEVVKSASSFICDMTKNVVFIVPDRFSMFAEKTIFSITGQSVLFNVEVVGISKFINKFFADKSEMRPLTSLQIDLLTRNAILKCKDQFLFFPKDNIGVSLSREISKTIASIKASGVTYLQMRESYEGDDISLKNKIHDLSLVYETYENNSEKNGLDPNDMIEKFLQLSVFDEMSTQDVFVAGFDSFTSLGYKLIEKIILNASSFTIGTVGAMGQRNVFVYEEEMRIRIAGICKKNKIECSILQCDNDFNLNDRHICENFNVFKPQRIKNDEFIEVLECKDVKEEVGVVARKIKELIVEKNYRYNEINVALSNANEFNGTIKDVFEKFEIPFYLDEKISLKSTLLSKFILSFLTLFRFGFRMEDVKEFLLSPFVNIPMSLKHKLFNHIDKYQREGSEIFKPLDFDYDGKEQLEQLIFDNLTILNKFKLISLKSMEINEFIAIINELINNFMIKDKIVQITQEDNLGKNYVQEKINLQCEEKLKAVFDDLSVLGGEEVSLEDFYSFLDLALESKEISTVPLLVDCVYVGDATDSFFTPQKALFVLGANSDVLPKTNFDNGVISDRDIEAVADRAVLEPSIKMINFRNRFKLLNLLCLGENKLFVSFQSENSDGKARMPSQIVIDLRAMFFEKEGEILPICHGKKIAQLNALETKKACNEFAKTISCNFGAKEFLAGVSNEEPLLFEAAKEAILKILFKSTGYCLEKYLDVENERLDRATQLFFLDNRISATGLEKFNKCPFLFFCENGLGLKKESPMDFESIDIGSILHKCVELFCRENVGQLKTMEIADIAKISNNIFKKVILNGKYQYFLKKIEFKPIINLIKKELIRTCEKIVCEQKNSNYCVKHLEKHFGFDEENALSFQIGSQKIRLNGVIDRIDEFEEGFRVIDYKTGNVKNGLKNVYCGINLQLFLYAASYKILSGKKATGVLYFPIKDKMQKGVASDILVGYIISDFDNVKNYDISLCEENPKSAVLGVWLKKVKANEVPTLKIGKGLLLDKEFQDVMNYCVKLAGKTMSEISDGNIDASPIDVDGIKICEYCKYSSICNFDKTGGDHAREIKDSVTAESFKLEANDGND